MRDMGVGWGVVELEHGAERKRISYCNNDIFNEFFTLCAMPLAPLFARIFLILLQPVGDPVHGWFPIV